MKSNNFRATYQVLNTLIPYFLLWFLAVKASAISIFLLPPIIVLIVLFSLRIFSLMHDCGHYSLFTSKAANRIVGFIFGVLTAMPQYWWSRDHAYHHKTNGDWERYRGIGDFLSLDEYDGLSTFDKKVYDFTRHPRMVLPGGFFYLAFKPRLVLLLGMVDFVGDVYRSFKQNPSIKFSEAIASHRPKHWGSTAEFWDLLLNGFCVVGGWILCCQTLGTAFFLGTYSVVLALSAASLIAVFFVQHNFDGAYAHKTADWNYLLGAVEGSSYLDIPPILKWFTADISYHNIHHLSEKIPNYNLRACHEKNAHLLGRVTKVRLGDIMRCSEFVLWDAQSDSLVSIKDYSS
ncbi:fatty acid desaturase [[Limnothrix rosea] IAM M-220]|uniref:fatty acid desaturase n=1 Tax=[Limnothrix rosea] IAM M-220 TaxID=454133 RepID=UPI001F43442E|nr:fatty acid desaturase [[Limnothrix rosea] IAM M-220]